MAFCVVAQNMVERSVNFTGLVVPKPDEMVYILDTDDFAVERYKWSDVKKMAEQLPIQGIYSLLHVDCIQVSQIYEGLGGRLRFLGKYDMNPMMEFGQITCDDTLLLKPYVDSNGVVHFCRGDGTSLAMVSTNSPVRHPILSYFMFGQKIGNYYYAEVGTAFRCDDMTDSVVITYRMVFTMRSVLGIYNIRGKIYGSRNVSESNIPKSLLAKIQLVSKF